MKNYAIDTGDGNQLTAGLQGHDYARRVAQQFANERGESVWLYAIPVCLDDDGEATDESEEVKPTR